MAHRGIVVLNSGFDYHDIEPLTIAIDSGASSMKEPLCAGVSAGSWTTRGDVINHYLNEGSWAIIPKFTPAGVGYKVKPITINGRVYYV